MSTTIEIRVPNIGDFANVPVIEVLVAPGDTIAPETPLVTLESEKTTMDVPAPQGGVVRDVSVAVGDKVSEGTILLTLVEAGSPETAAGGAAESASRNGDVATAAEHATAAASATPASRGETVAPASVPDAPGAAVATPVDVRVPNIGDFAGVPIVEILVAPGDTIAIDTPLVTLESEKTAMDVPAPRAGVVRDVAVAVGDKVSEGTLLLTLEPAVVGGKPVPSAARADDAGAPTPTSVRGNGAPSADGPRPFADVASSTPTVRDAGAGAAVAPSPTETNAIVHASPSVRRFARELGVDLRAVAPSGPHARITRDDVRAFVKRVVATGAVAAPASAAPGGMPFGLPELPKIDFAKYGPIDVVPLSRIRRISGPSLHRSWLTIPHVTNNDEADVTEIEAFRKTLNAESSAAKVTMLAFVMTAVVAALRAFPEVNASLDGDALVLKRYYHLGFAADTPGGLVVPVVRDVDRKGVLAIASETAALAAKARDGKLAPTDVGGATFTISSLGGIGGTSFTPIVNAPEVAILGVSRATMRPVWDGETFVPRLILPLSLSYDHRVIDGALAARFNARVVALLGDLRRAML